MSDKNKLQKILSVLKGTPKTITLEEKQIQKLQDEVNKLKELNDIDTQFDIDMLLEQKASFPMFQWQKKLVAQYHFFITVLGMIDSNLDDCQHQITFFSNFENVENEMKSLQNQCAQHMSKREELIENYKEVNSNDLPFVLEIITHYPSYQAFQRLYTDLDENQYQLPLQLEFINAYNNGYIMASKVDTDIVFDRYESMFQELRNHKDKNKQKAKKIRTTKILKLK